MLLHLSLACSFTLLLLLLLLLLLRGSQGLMH
jgi:hypothetical protein